MRFIDGSTLEIRRRMIAPDFRKIYSAPYLLYHRADLHTELKRTATEPRPPLSKVAKINLLSEVTKIDLDGHITLSDGRQIKKDLIVVADGVRVRVVCSHADALSEDPEINNVPEQIRCRCGWYRGEYQGAAVRDHVLPILGANAKASG